MEKFDVCVIGAGPGGYVAAIRAGQNGLKTALVEKEFLGGTCLNVGCIPTKTLIAGAEVLSAARRAGEFGVEISGEIRPDWKKMLARKNEVIGKLRNGIAGLEKAAGVTIFSGRGEFLNRKQLVVAQGEHAGTVIEASKFIIASGSEPLVPGFIPQGDRILTSTELLSLPKLPKSLLISTSEQSVPSGRYRRTTESEKVDRDPISRKIPPDRIPFWVTVRVSPETPHRGSAPVPSRVYSR